MTLAAPALLLAALLGMAQVGFPDAMSDPRIQTVAYVADQVVPLRVSIGYAAVVEFAPDEAVDNVVVGNSAVWQVTPNRRGDRLIVKPLAGATPTNMIVVTDVRRYVFMLEPAEGQGQAPFVLRFAYPPPAPVQLSAARLSATYRLGGNKALLPIVMSDDGARTTIGWKPDTSLPAIFATDARGHEAIVNGRMIGGDYVVEGIAPRYVFRLGKARATATRRPLTAPR